MKCSFAKESMKNTFESVWEWGSELFGRYFYLENNEEQLLICAFDFSMTFPVEARRFTSEVSKATGIPEKSIWYHELQIHAAPGGKELAGIFMDKIIAKTIKAVKKLKETAVDFELYACEADLGREFSFNREQYVEGLGGVTVWTGMTFDKEGEPCTQNKDIMLLRGYKPDLPVFDKPIYFDNPNDPKAYLFVFKDKNGKTIGSISRFAAHPDIAVLFELRFHPNRFNEYHYNYDWPGYMSDGFEEKLGGISMYINGPCADLTTKKGYDGLDLYKDAENECKRIGNEIGNRIFSEYEKNSKKVDLHDGLKTDKFEIPLPMKEDIPYSLEGLDKLQSLAEEAENKLQQAINDNKPASTVKKLIDDRWRIGHLRHMIIDCENFSEEEMESHIVNVQVPVASFGGYLFVGVPGEALVDMSLWLRSQFTGVKTVPVDQVGGYYNYVATPRSMTLGGYTYWSSWVRRDATLILKKHLTDYIGKFIQE